MKKGYSRIIILSIVAILICTSGVFAQTDSNIKVGFAIRTLDSPYYVALGDAIKAGCEELGWEVSVLDANTDSEKEAQNMDALVAQGVDLIFLDSVIPDPAVAAINKAAENNIGVINLDSGVGEGAKDITTIYSNNEQNGRLVGLAYANSIDKNDPIKAILLSGNKGSIAGEQRRTGLFCGIIEARTGLSEADAWIAAKDMEKQLVENGKAENTEANFVIGGQGWGAWTREGGLEAAEDLITANQDLTCVLAENDQMNFGAMIALENAGIENVDILSAADGAKQAYDLIKEGKYFATGENSPVKIAEKGIEIAKAILIDGADMWSYPDITFTEAFAVTIDNVDEHYDFGF